MGGVVYIHIVHTWLQGSSRPCDAIHACFTSTLHYYWWLQVLVFGHGGGGGGGGVAVTDLTLPVLALSLYKQHM